MGAKKVEGMRHGLGGKKGGEGTQALLQVVKGHPPSIWGRQQEYPTELLLHDRPCAGSLRGGQRGRGGGGGVSTHCNMFARYVTKHAFCNLFWHIQGAWRVMYRV